LSVRGARGVAIRISGFSPPVLVALDGGDRRARDILSLISQEADIGAPISVAPLHCAEGFVYALRRRVETVSVLASVEIVLLIEAFDQRLQFLRLGGANISRLSRFLDDSVVRVRHSGLYQLY
jgi:hypothetical protein